MHAALACATSRVRCGSLVYSIGYRHPAVLAKAITAIDHLSGGRADMGLGAGWAQVEYDAYGIPFPAAGVRLDQLEEGIQVLRGLLHDEVTTFEGTYFRVTEARNEPRPVQAKLPIWIGGQGEKRTLRIAAQYADGWNVPFVGARAVRGTSATCCIATAPTSAAIRATSAARSTSGWRGPRSPCGPSSAALADFVRPGVLSGSVDEVVERIGRYVEAGADQVNIALRAPFDVDAARAVRRALSST